MTFTLISTDFLDTASVTNESIFYQRYLFEESDGQLSLESFEIDSYDNSVELIQFLFSSQNGFDEIFRSERMMAFDLSKIKASVITLDKLEATYQDWISRSNRQNTMDEYGGLLGLIGYVNRHADKKNLYLISVLN